MTCTGKKPDGSPCGEYREKIVRLYRELPGINAVGGPNVEWLGDFCPCCLKRAMDSLKIESIKVVEDTA
jgi:hypothetical protein